MSSTLTGATKSIARTCAVCGSSYLQSAGHTCPLGGPSARPEDGLEGAVIDDRYKIDKMLFSPAEIILHNVDTGRVHIAGGVRHDILAKSFGIA